MKKTFMILLIVCMLVLSFSTLAFAQGNGVNRDIDHLYETHLEELVSNSVAAERVDGKNPNNPIYVASD